jgi:hypothetical protein
MKKHIKLQAKFSAKTKKAQARFVKALASIARWAFLLAILSR